MQASGFFVAMLSIGLVFMRYSDKVNQRVLFATSSVVQIIGMALLAVFPLTTLVALAYLVLVWFGSGFGAQSFFQFWSAELFPTLSRSTAQGITFAVVRISLGLWSFFEPVLTKTGSRGSPGSWLGSWWSAGSLGRSGHPGPRASRCSRSKRSVRERKKSTQCSYGKNSAS